MVLQSTFPRISTIDCHYIAPQFAASYLIVDGREAAFIDNNTIHSQSYLIDALVQSGLSLQDVRWLIVTHVHLDHASGTESLLRVCPNAKVIAHPKASPHLIDPRTLQASAEKVYGKEKFRELYGDLRPIDALKVQSVEEGQKVPLGQSELEIWHTRGHANHHICIWDERSQSIFTGDSFGLAYPALQDQGLFILPSTSPTDFDPAAALATVKRIAESPAETAHLSHFGKITDLKDAASQLSEDLEKSAQLLQWVEGCLSQDPDAALESVCETKLWEHLNDRKHLESWQRKLLTLDIQLNASGIIAAAKKEIYKKQKREGLV